MTSDRLFNEVRRLVLLVWPTAAYWVPRRFRVVKMHAGDQRVELQAVNRSLGFPDPLPISMTPGMAGLSAALAPGCEVLVSFVDGDPGQPVITHFTAPDAPGWLPVSLVLDAQDSVTVGASASEVLLGASLRMGVARIGDTVQAGPFSGVITSGSTTVKAGA